MASTDSARDELLAQLTEDFIERHRRGERPSLTEYIGRYPDLAEDIRELFPALVQLEHLKPVEGDLSGFVDPTPSKTSFPERLGDYRILREVGRGGMGVVYEAEQESLGRHVALKVLPSHALLGGTYLERFRREARAAAKLHHTNIVPVFGVGEADGVHFYAMQYIRGEALDKVLNDLRELRKGHSTAVREEGVASGLVTGRFIPEGDGSSETTVVMHKPDEGTPSGFSSIQSNTEYYRSVARVGVQVAEALGHAHRQGVLHRDIKPSNLLLDSQGRVWITDFGLAKAEGSEELTQTGDIVGTLRFMAPERFEGHSQPESDLYALGLTLYELLTLQPAFNDTNKARLVEMILHGVSIPPRKIDRNIPRDLETVVLKCLAKDPRERYASAEALVEDLERFLADRPIKARRTGTGERFWRWCRRNPWIAGLGAAVFLLLAMTAIGGVAMSIRYKDSLDKTDAARLEVKRKLFQSSIAEADAKRSSGRSGQRFDTLRRIREALEIGREIGITEEDRFRLRNIAIAAFCLPDIESETDWVAYKDAIPKGLDPVLDWRARAHVIVKSLPSPAHFLKGAKWASPDGRFIAVGTEQYIRRVSVPVRVWRVDRPVPELMIQDSNGASECATAFSPDSKLIALGHENGTISVYHTESGKPYCRLPAGSNSIHSLSFHPKLRQLAVVGGNEAAVWDLETQQRKMTTRQGAYVYSVEWHPKGHRLALGVDRTIALVDARTGNRIGDLWKNHASEGVELRFNQSGDRLISTSWINKFHIWDASTGDQLFTGSAPSCDLQVGSDDRSIGLIGKGHNHGTLRIAFCRELSGMRPTFSPPMEGVASYTLHPDGRVCVAVTSKGLYFLDLATREGLGVIPGSFSKHLRFDQYGNLWTSGAGGVIFWPITFGSNQANRMQIGPPERVADCLRDGYDGFQISSDANVIAITRLSDGVELIRRKPTHRVLRLGPQYDARHVHLSPDGRWVLTGSHHSGGAGEDLKLWDAESGKLLSNFPDHLTWVQFRGFSFDGTRIMFDWNGRFQVDLASILAHPTLSRYTDSSSWPRGWKVEHLPEGKLFVANSQLYIPESSDGSLPLVNPETGKQVAILHLPKQSSVVVSGAANRSKVVALSIEEGVLYQFNLTLIRKQLRELGLDWEDGPTTDSLPEEIETEPAPLEWEMRDTQWTGSREKAARRETDLVVSRLTANPLDGYAHYRIGKRLLEKGKAQSAFAHLSAALLFRPDLDDARYQRALAGSRLGRSSEAIADASLFLAKVPFDTPGRRLRAKLYADSKQYPEAIGDYSSLLLTYPSSGLYHEQRAACYAAIGKTELANADRVKAERFSVNSGTQLNNRAWHLVTGPKDQHDPKEALILIGKAMATTSNPTPFLNTLGVIQYRNQMYDEAISTLQKSLKAGNGADDGYDLYFLAMCYAARKDLPKAKEYFDRAEKWYAAQKNLTAESIEELSAFRDEALQLIPG